MTIVRRPYRILSSLSSLHRSRQIRLHLPDCRWSCSALLQKARCQVEERWFIFRLTICSLFYNSVTSSWTVVDTLLEPLFWFVDHFVRYLGPVSYGFVFHEEQHYVSSLVSRQLWLHINYYKLRYLKLELTCVNTSSSHINMLLMHSLYVYTVSGKKRPNCFS